MQFKRLSEIALIEISNVDKKVKDGETPVLLCNFTDVYSNFELCNEDLAQFMKGTATSKEIDKFKLKKGDVVITKDSETRGDIGMSCYIADNLSNTILGYHCALIRPKEGIDGGYLNACLQSPLSRKYFSNQASGSGQRYTLTLDGIGNVKIPVIPYDKQIKVTKWLADINKKIRINSQINDNLHQLIYEYYMKLFATKKANGILSDLLLDEQKSKTQVGEVKGRDGNYPFFTSGEEILKSDKFLVDGSHIFMNTGGNPDVKFYKGKCDYSTDTWCIKASNGMTEYLFLYLLSIKSFLEIKFFKGTGLKHLQKDLLRKNPIYIPKESELKAFNEVVALSLEKISANYRENMKLIAIRNKLLPLLMNGQVSIR